MAAKIEIRNVSKSFVKRSSKKTSKFMVVSDASLSIRENEFVVFIGPSGCGKTTLLRMIDGLIEPDEGTILIDGKGPPKPGPNMGFVFQSFRLLPWRNVLDNVLFPMEVQGVPKPERIARALSYVRMVGLDGFESSYPHQLSGGMQQRVALARALVMDPQILLMDEPFASLDAQTREFMQTELLKIWASKRNTVVFVTHSLDEALVLADRIVLFGPRPAKVEEIIDVPFRRPRWEYDVRAEPKYAQLRAHLWSRIKEMVEASRELPAGELTPPRIPVDMGMAR
ncbi:MAG: ABC transporter ATP-binding protein [Thaumarchaeota archaeon]|nr:ABC transporter ATP-binding protein [Nitrososphaerota archaeon]